MLLDVLNPQMNLRGRYETASVPFFFKPNRSELQIQELDDLELRPFSVLHTPLKMISDRNHNNTF